MKLRRNGWKFSKIAVASVLKCHMPLRPSVPKKCCCIESNCIACIPYSTDQDCCHKIQQTAISIAYSSHKKRGVFAVFFNFKSEYIHSIMTDTTPLKKWKTGENPDAVIEQITIILKFWGKKASQLEVGLIMLGTVSIVSALAVGAFADLDIMKYKQSLPLKILGFLSALCLTLINSFNMADRANRVRKAWRHLNKALYRYNSDIVNIKEVVAAYDEGEEMIGSTVEFSYSKK